MQVLQEQICVVDIGPLQGALRLPTDARKRANMETICDACGKPITDEYFIGGFKTGHCNMKFHEACASDQVIGLIARGTGVHAEWAKELLTDRLMECA